MENTLLNLIPSSYIPEVHLSQYDIGRELTFKLMDGNTEYSVPSGAVVTVKATKPSGLGFVVSGTFSGNIVTIVNTETMTNESGRFSAELSISSGATLLGTSNFIFNIERSPHPEGTTDGDAETLIPELTLLVNEIRESNAKVESMTASATSLPAGSEPTAEYDAENNNLAFGIPVPEVTAEDLYKAFITKSASGSIASFSDGGDELPMKSLKVSIVPKQSGTGDPSPSNVRPISGYEGVNVTRCGKNLLDPAYRTEYGTNTIDYYKNADGLLLKANTTYVFSVSHRNGEMSILKKLTNEKIAYIYSNTVLKYTPTEDVRVRFSVYFSSSSPAPSGGLSAVTCQVEVGTEATEYEPYNSASTSYPISLGQTVYGGTLEVMSGKLTIERFGYVFNGTETIWSGDQSGHTRFTVVNALAEGPAYTRGQWCSHFTPNTAPIGANNYNNVITGYTPVKHLFIRADAYATADDLKAYILQQYQNGTPVTYVSYLQTPTEIQLTPTEVKTLLGSNNIWSESGTVEVEYRADSTLAYEELINAVISLGGNI